MVQAACGTTLEYISQPFECIVIGGNRGSTIEGLRDRCKTLKAVVSQLKG